ncbi:hypothetical protein HAZT_HAZT011441 [Hyalella azteca]|uniref:Ig-like domain-containing protein n=1 Tax=Hyalella azteca TaxID=294128 RepID=A0A6A0GRZ3_HYAAZ|nr:hypothetical protein HAZT_HAZT011441 [Hyalella azteca]
MFVDGRSTPLPHAHHWQDSSLLNSGAHFNTAKEGPALVLRAVRRTDQGLYRCRVDFRRSRSRNFRMKLDIVDKLAYTVSERKQFVEVSISDIFTSFGHHTSKTKALNAIILMFDLVLVNVGWVIHGH